MSYDALVNVLQNLAHLCLGSPQGVVSLGTAICSLIILLAVRIRTMMESHWFQLSGTKKYWAKCANGNNILSNIYRTTTDGCFFNLGDIKLSHVVLELLIIALWDHSWQSEKFSHRKTKRCFLPICIPVSEVAFRPWYRPKFSICPRLLRQNCRLRQWPSYENRHLFERPSKCLPFVLSCLYPQAGHFWGPVDLNVV